MLIKRGFFCFFLLSDEKCVFIYVFSQKAANMRIIWHLIGSIYTNVLRCIFIQNCDFCSMITFNYKTKLTKYWSFDHYVFLFTLYVYENKIV